MSCMQIAYPTLSLWLQLPRDRRLPLHKALLLNLIIEAEQDAELFYFSSGTSDDDTSESQGEDGPSQVEDHLQSIADLYTAHHYNT